MHLSDVIEGRRSIRKYKTDPVPDELLIKVLESARLAPSAANRQPWHFIVVQDRETKEKLAARQKWAADAPVLIVGLGDTARAQLRAHLSGLIKRGRKEVT
jgi:nitroreductase